MKFHKTESALKKKLCLISVKTRACPKLHSMKFQNETKNHEFGGNDVRISLHEILKILVSPILLHNVNSSSLWSGVVHIPIKHTENKDWIVSSTVIRTA
jgi:hypothetical protein